jgi:hypothetical protein
MTKKKLIEDIKLNPARFYRTPSDVNRDRRFSNEERLQILEAWERDARAVSCDDDSEESDSSRLRQVFDARAELEKRMPSAETMPPQKDPHPKLGSAGHS